MSPAAPSSPRGIEIVGAPEGIPSSRCRADTASKLIPDDDKFALENLARWEHGLLVHVPKGVELDKPLYVQVTRTVARSSGAWS